MTTMSLLIAFLTVTWHLIIATIDASPPSARNATLNPATNRLCCAVLHRWMGDLLAYPDTGAYTSSCASYWSRQEAHLSPGCIVRPRSSQDVSTTVWLLRTLSRYQALLGQGPGCTFAIRGGGHTPWPGSANIDGGVTIDLSRMKDVSVSDDRTLTAVGPGAKWMDVYLKLDALGLAVSGGRVSDVGVAGLTTGGGLSFFAPRYGLVCDNVENFEVVLASGEIVNANARERSDLWFALKGGSNNFGVVTRFDLKTFEQGRFWGGVVGYPIHARFHHFRAFERFNGAAPSDEYAALINSYAYSSRDGWMIANSYEYTRPVAYPAVFRPFTDDANQTYNTMRISNLTDFTVELNDRSNQLDRKMFMTTTVGNSAVLLERIHDFSNSSLQTILPCAELTWALTYQAVPVSIPIRSASRGGNALGLDANHGPMVIVLLSVFWRDPADDDRIERAVRTLFDQTDRAASDMGLAKDWIYLNYAAPWQDPIRGYGSVNRKRLQEISRRYDPRGLFQNNVPGGFKLFR